jgi:ABC-2 type transport system permease protein
VSRLVRSAFALYIGHLLGYLRSRTAIYWTLAFPLFFLVIFGFAFGRGRLNFDQLMPGLLAITVVSGSLFGVALRMVTERETGILRRHRLTPVHPVAIVLAHGGVALTTLAGALLVQSTVAAMLFGFSSKGSIASLIAVLFMGALAIVPIGLVVGSVARDSRVAPAMTNFLFFPLMFLSGAAIPFAFLPDWMQRLGRLVPSTYLVDSLQGVIVRGVGFLHLGTSLLMLAITAVVGITVNGLLFRWEGTDPVRKGRLLAALGVLAVIYVASYFVGPALHISERIR